MPLPEQTDPVAKVLEQALLTLKTVVGTLKLYPRESPICQQILQNAHEPLQNFLKTIEHVLISDTGTGLTMEGSKPMQVKGFRELLIVHKIRNIKLFRGVTASEISFFCEGLGKKKEDLASFPDFNTYLVSKGVQHIQTDEIRYIDVQENERVVIRGMGEVSGTPGESGGSGTGSGGGLGGFGSSGGGAGGSGISGDEEGGPGGSGGGKGGEGGAGSGPGRIAGVSPTGNIPGTINPGSGSGVPVIQVIRQTLNQISKVTDAALQGALRDGLSADLAKMSAEDLETLMTSKDTPEGALDEVVQNLPLSKIEDILRHVVEKHEQIKVQVQGDSDRAQRLDLLNTFLRQVMTAPASREIPPQLYSYLSSLGLLENVPGGGMKGGQYFSFTAVAENLMELPVEFLVTKPLSDHLVELVKNLCAREPDESLPNLINRVQQNLDNVDDALRNHTVNLLVKLHGVLINGGSLELADYVRQRLLDAANVERNIEVYKNLATGIQTVAMGYLMQWHYEEVAQIIAQFRRHAKETFALPQGRFEQARHAVHLFALRSADSLCEDLAVPDHQTGALKVLAQLGDEVTGPLIAMLRKEPTPRTQQVLLQALDAVGSGSQKFLIEHLQVGSPAKELLQILSLITPFIGPPILPRIAPLLQHPSGQVRREAALILSKINDANVPNLLHPLLKDPDPHVQEVLIRYLGETRASSTAQLLLPKLESASATLQEEICIALGRIHNPIAIPALINCLCAQTGFWSKKPLYEETVRLRAASALAGFLNDPKVQKALKQSTKDASPLVRQTADQVLRNAA